MKILYITTVSGTINSFLVPHIKMLVESGHSVDLAANITSEINKELVELGCNIFNIPFKRNPFAISNIKAYSKLKKIIRKENYEVIHTHTPVASFVSRLSTISERKKGLKVIYTSHGFHFHKKSSIMSWIIYYSIEKFLSLFTDAIITINKEDFKLAKEKFGHSDIYYIPGVGYDNKKFFKLNSYNKKNIKLTNNVNEDDIVLISTGELNDNKNHIVVLEAIKILIEQNRIKNLKYFICGEGPLRPELEKFIIENNLSNNVNLKGKISNVNDMLNISNMFLFPSKREGLGIAALEAMSIGLPIITSNIHGIVDYSINNITGFTCNPNDISCFANSIEKISNLENIEDICNSNINISKKYQINNSLLELKKVYKLIGISIK